MGNQLELLKRLQVLDGELFRLRRQQQDKPLELEQVEAQVAAQDVRVKTAESRLSTLQLAQKEKELELQTREANVRKLQGQLFQVKTNKEYTTMQREIDTLKADNSLLEEAILNAFDAIEQAMKDRQREHAKLVEQQGRLRAERERIAREVAEIEERIARLEHDRQGLTPDVPPKVLSKYEQVLEIRDGLALVPLVNDACGGCHRRLPPQVINQVYLKADIVMCESCNRILYSDEAHSKL